MISPAGLVSEPEAEKGESQEQAADVSLLEQSAACLVSRADCPSSEEQTPSEARSTREIEIDLQVPYLDSLDPASESLQLETRGLTSHPNPLEVRRDAPDMPQKDAGGRGSSQFAFWAANSAHKFSMAAKLREVGDEERAKVLEDCHSRKTFAECRDCQKSQVFLNRCDQNFCPECQPRLARDRAQGIEWWIKEIGQPKHVVLTARNSHQITRKRLVHLKSALTKLRRRKEFRNWKGGLWSMETTNEGRGWHVHFHLLIDVKWIDARRLAAIWAELIGQEFAIVKVKDARQGDYLREVTKYVAKGSELAKWSGTDLKSFLDALKGLRTFGVFGSLYGKRTEWREWLNSLSAKGMTCPCGGVSFTFYDENEFHASGCSPSPEPSPRPPPSAQLDMTLNYRAEARCALSRGL
jgi:Replication protein